MKNGRKRMFPASKASSGIRWITARPRALPVYQSEPLGKPNMPVIYDLTDGLDERDIARLSAAGSQISIHRRSRSRPCPLSIVFHRRDPALRAIPPRICGHWPVSGLQRYGAYPVLWTTAQEIDPHCYGTCRRNAGLLSRRPFRNGMRIITP